MKGNERQPPSPGMMRRGWTLLRQAYAEFMTVPTVILLGFLVLAALTMLLDTARASWILHGKVYLETYLFSSVQSTQSLLGTLVGGLLTVLSITFSVLLLAVQQTAGTLTNQVYDQFLRRRVNQIYFGYFIGLVVYTILVLAMIAPYFNPVYSSACVVILTTAGLCLLVLLIYSTIDQMRPTTIIKSIHDHILAARRGQQSLLQRTRRASCSEHPVQARVRAETEGFFSKLDLYYLRGPLAKSLGEIEVLPTIGDFVAFGDVLVLIREQTREAGEKLVPVVRKAIQVTPERNLDRDPALGITELETIGWTTTSSAKSNPSPARMVVNALRDLIGRWSLEGPPDEGNEAGDPLPVVYTDTLLRQSLNALATIAAGTSESRQNTVLTTVLQAFAHLLEHPSVQLREQIEDMIRRTIPALQELIFTRDLDAALTHLVQSLHAVGAHETVALLQKAQEERSRSVGRLHP